MANLILASKREVKSGAQMWHVYQHENGAKVAESEFYFALPYKALRYAFMLRKRTGAIIPKAVYNKLMADVSASKAQAEPSAAQESAPEAEQAAEPSAHAKAYESMKAKHPDACKGRERGFRHHPHTSQCKGHHRTNGRFPTSRTR